VRYTRAKYSGSGKLDDRLATSYHYAARLEESEYLLGAVEFFVSRRQCRAKVGRREDGYCRNFAGENTQCTLRTSNLFHTLADRDAVTMAET
jgi:hypothetical protein